MLQRPDDRVSSLLTPAHSIHKLLAINKRTGIEARSAVQTFEDGIASHKDPPSLAQLDQLFRTAGVDLTVQACLKALGEAALSPADITHAVAVTCTNQGNPGYDLLVHRQLGLSHAVERTLLHGVGCAGGLATMRIAAQMALGATARSRPARILVFACELCTPLVRTELAEAERSSAADVGIAATLFSDAAAAFILVNDLGRSSRPPIYQLLDTFCETLPDTLSDMSFYFDSSGLCFSLLVSRPSRLTLPAL